MKKRIALLAAATLVMSSLSGCASNSTAPETTATATTQAEKETTASDTQATSTGDTGEWSKTITLADGKTYPSGTTYKALHINCNIHTLIKRKIAA